MRARFPEQHQRENFHLSDDAAKDLRSDCHFYKRDFNSAEPKLTVTHRECADHKAVPRFGLGSARWVVVETEFVAPEAGKPDPAKGSTGMYTHIVAAYTSYGACVYRQPKDMLPAENGGNTVWWETCECKPAGEFH